MRKVHNIVPFHLLDGVANLMILSHSIRSSNTLSIRVSKPNCDIRVKVSSSIQIYLFNLNNILVYYTACTSVVFNITVGLAVCLVLACHASNQVTILDHSLLFNN